MRNICFLTSIYIIQYSKDCSFVQNSHLVLHISVYLFKAYLFINYIKNRRNSSEYFMLKSLYCIKHKRLNKSINYDNNNNNIVLIIVVIKTLLLTHATFRQKHTAFIATESTGYNSFQFYYQTSNKQIVE